MKNTLYRLYRNDTLNKEESREIMIRIGEGRYTEAEIASFLTVFQMRGITIDEMIGFKDGLQTTQKKLDLDGYNPIDIVGTGGDGKNTFNISTCACFVVSGAGYNVVKHGNYGASSVSGASDIMEMHGIKFTDNSDQIKKSLDLCKMAYLHAPLFTPAMKSVATARKNLSMRTIFNLLGPLVNPCHPKGQLLGVADLSLMRLYTYIMQKLGMGFAIVTSIDGFDEISLTGGFKVSATKYEKYYQPYDLSLPTIQAGEIYGGKNKTDAMKIFDSVLDNSAPESQKNVVIANAAFAIQTIAPEKDIEECMYEARYSLESGKAKQSLKQFISINS